MGKAKVSSLRGSVLAAAPKTVHGFPAWHQRIPAEVLSEFSELKNELWRGELPHTRAALAKGMQETLKSLGIITIGWEAIDRWLAKRD